LHLPWTYLISIEVICLSNGQPLTVCTEKVKTPMAFDLLFQGESLTIRQILEQIEFHERRLETLCEEVEKLKVSQTRIESQERKLENLGLDVEKLTVSQTRIESQERKLETLGLEVGKWKGSQTRIESHERGWKHLVLEVEKWKVSQTRIESQERILENLGLEVENLREMLESLPKAIPDSRNSTPKPSPSPTPEKSVGLGDFPLKEANSLEGIISYLRKKHGGNVHEKEIVTITSKSVGNPKWAPKNVADLTSGSCFCSNGAPGQWICWDFNEMRVRPTHYTIQTYWLKSWVVESSLDGENWTEIDRKTDNQDFERDLNRVSFTVWKPVESRFIRLTQTDKRHCDDDTLVFRAVEFFGTLS
jgi:hypothetical protein